MWLLQMNMPSGGSGPLKVVKDFVRSRPALYDRVRGAKRGLFGSPNLSFNVLDEFSKSHNGQVNFIQIGANDGLRNDPLRPLIVRDDWQGVLVEPLPTVFPLLKSNYAYLNRPGLVFTNAAITVDGLEKLSFWSFTEEFLKAQTLEDRLDYLRKASFDREHVAGFLPAEAKAEQVLEEIQVPCLSLEQIVNSHLPRKPLHLLVIDAEGYESVLIPGIDFSVVKPEAVFFESEHLGPEKEPVFSHLKNFGYSIEKVGLDSMAVL